MIIPYARLRWNEFASPLRTRYIETWRWLQEKSAQADLAFVAASQLSPRGARFEALQYCF